MPIPEFTVYPDRQDSPETFADDGDQFLSEMAAFIDGANTLASDVTALEGTAVAAASSASGSASAASASASAAATSAATALAAPGTNATSTTSLTVGTGAKSLTIQTGKSLVVGMTVKIAYTTTPTTWMSGDITAYNSGTGALDVNVDSTQGSGTQAAWTVSLSAPGGVTPAGVQVITNKTIGSSIINEVKGADVASATTTNLDAATGNFVHITGATTITAITLASGAERVVVFDGALILTHHATTLILPGGVNILTAAGDRAVFRGDGTGNVRCMEYVRATGPVVLQEVSVDTGAVASDNTTIPWDDTIPQKTEGFEYMTLAITPKSASSYLLVEVVAALSISTNSQEVISAIFRDSGANALGAVSSHHVSGQMYITQFSIKVASGATTATTFKFRAGREGSAAGTVTFNGISGSRKLGGVCASSIRILEVRG